MDNVDEKQSDTPIDPQVAPEASDALRRQVWRQNAMLRRVAAISGVVGFVLFMLTPFMPVDRKTGTSIASTHPWCRMHRKTLISRCRSPR